MTPSILIASIFFLALLLALLMHNAYHDAQPEIDARTWLAQQEEICWQIRETDPDFPGVLQAPGTRRTGRGFPVRREKEGVR